MSQTRSILRAAGKHRRNAEQSLAEVVADIQENADSERRLLSTLAQIESILRQVGERVAHEGLNDELLLIRNRAVDQLANCHDMLRRRRESAAHLQTLRASFDRIATQAAEIANHAAGIPSDG